jgi:hypothetical protein
VIASTHHLVLTRQSALGAATAKIQRHESKASLLGGQPFDSTYKGYSGGFREREGYAPGSKSNSRPSKMYRPNSLWTWSFVIITVVQAAVVLALES